MGIWFEKTFQQNRRFITNHSRVNIQCPKNIITISYLIEIIYSDAKLLFNKQRFPQKIAFRSKYLK